MPSKTLLKLGLSVFMRSVGFTRSRMNAKFMLPGDLSNLWNHAFECDINFTL